MKGNIAVQSENIFPIIKKFLYSDQEIFLRELIANAIDATSKIKTLSSKGDFKGTLGDLTLQIKLDEAAKTLTISDSGLGLTGEEAVKYLSEVAFSSATEFLEKFKGEVNIIGHFGLGFYSAFMVASRVEVVSKSWKEDEKAIRWTCEGNPEYELTDAERTTRGTDIILHISDDATEYLNNHRIQELLDKYCKFLPIPIQFGTKTETISEGEGDEKTATDVEIPNIVNDTNPLWKKQPSELKDEDYIDFYKKLHPFSPAPSFWVHLNIDYPFNLTGVLYFPKTQTSNVDLQRNKISLYSNQVYVTDDVREIVPEFLTLLHGVIDSPDIPLNVSRSALQSDRDVKKITDYITRKVADKLDDIARKTPDTFKEKWEGISVFVKYGMLTDEKFAEKGKKFWLIENLDNQLFTFEQYREKIQANQTDKDGNLVVLYSTNNDDFHTYASAARSKNYDIALFGHPLDSHFLQKIEAELDKVSFKRIDSDTLDQLIKKDETFESVLSTEEQTKVEDIFKTQIHDTFTKTQLSALSPEEAPVLITKPEWMRRMKDMQMLGGGMDFPDSYNIVINTNHPVIAQKLLNAGDQQNELAKQLINLARLQQGMLKGSELTDFIKSTTAMLTK
jgi:molecular chaperone HtpG